MKGTVLAVNILSLGCLSDFLDNQEEERMYRQGNNSPPPLLTVRTLGLEFSFTRLIVEDMLFHWPSLLFTLVFY